MIKIRICARQLPISDGYNNLMKNIQILCYLQWCLDCLSGALALMSTTTWYWLALPIHRLPLRSAFYAHLRLVAKMKFSPLCTNSVNGILCQKARQEGKNPQHSHLSVHLAGSASLSHYFAGGFFGSLDPTWYPAQRSQLKVSEEDLAPALLINGILKYVPLSWFFQDDKKLLSYRIKTL